MTKQVEAFKLAVPDTAIADLRVRLRRTRFPDQAPGPAWAYGTDIAWMRGLIDYWEKNSIGALRKPVSTPFRNTKCVCTTSICISFKSRGKDLTRVRCCYRTVGRARFLSFSS